MSEKVGRIWTNQELRDLGSTVQILRRIRTATTAQMEPPKRGVVGFFGKLLGEREFPTPDNRLAVLEEAERLGFAAGNYLATRFIRDNRDGQLLKAWESVLDETSVKYSDFPETTFAKTKNIDVIGSTLARMRVIYGDPSHMIKWDLFENNRLGASSIDALLTKKVTIIAPLSGDFLIAAVYQTYLEKTRRKTFKLKAAALSRNLKGVVLPDLGNQSDKEIGIYMDVVDSTKTGTALLHAAREEYPLARIHTPSTTPTNDIPFRPSARLIRKFGADAFPE